MAQTKLERQQAKRARWADAYERHNAARRALRAANPEPLRRAYRAWYAADPGKVCAGQRARYAADRLRCLDHYSAGTMKCGCCGEGTEQFLTMDHIDGRKTMGHNKSMSGHRLRRWLVKNSFPPGFQVLCYNCNCAKGFYGQCPHTATTEERSLLHASRTR